jgi:hypothetical protein
LFEGFFYLLPSIMDAAQNGIAAAQKNRPKGWEGGQTPGQGPSSPYMTKEKF